MPSLTPSGIGSMPVESMASTSGFRVGTGTYVEVDLGAGATADAGCTLESDASREGRAVEAAGVQMTGLELMSRVKPSQQESPGTPRQHEGCRRELQHQRFCALLRYLWRIFGEASRPGKVISSLSDSGLQCREDKVWEGDRLSRREWCFFLCLLDLLDFEDADLSDGCRERLCEWCQESLLDLDRL